MKTKMPLLVEPPLLVGEFPSIAGIVGDGTSSVSRVVVLSFEVGCEIDFDGDVISVLVVVRVVLKAVVLGACV